MFHVFRRRTNSFLGARGMSARKSQTKSWCCSSPIITLRSVTALQKDLPKTHAQSEYFLCLNGGWLSGWVNCWNMCFWWLGYRTRPDATISPKPSASPCPDMSTVHSSSQVAYITTNPVAQENKNQCDQEYLLIIFRTPPPDFFFGGRGHKQDEVDDLANCEFQTDNPGWYVHHPALTAQTDLYNKYLPLTILLWVFRNRPMLMGKKITSHHFLK